MFLNDNHVLLLLFGFPEQKQAILRFSRMACFFPDSTPLNFGLKGTNRKPIILGVPGFPFVNRAPYISP